MEGALTAVPGAHPPSGPVTEPAAADPAALGPVAARPLRGSRCPACAVTVHPADPVCPRCGGPAEPVVLSTTGTVWTWTVQRYAPKSPPYVPPEGGFRPFVVGYVELPEGVRILAVLDGVRPEEMRIDMPVTLTAGEGVPRARPADRDDAPRARPADPDGVLGARHAGPEGAVA
ncbi:Zn-ribbon domain-containing OB-fold protein [Streptomyces griseiscabiei]|uniref:OB-fold domain-containing protein n=1 Tax=Streptomyces griseiscabiei TaxID=2993540 RepID=A0ABU4L390_9ACTN|nr:OB-fold domain-containing protein [Streptomyces griseiscabiei]MDX2910192.1 OB-fold domain-containing protein [Streptomyces griseiscabiei]